MPAHLIKDIYTNLHNVIMGSKGGKKGKGAPKPFKNYADKKGERWCGDVFCKPFEGACPLLDKLVSFFNTDEVTCAAVAYETGVHGIHPHWQFYFQTAQRCRMKEKFQQYMGIDSGFHLEVAIGTRNANLKYVWATQKEHELGWVLYKKNCQPPETYVPEKTDNLLRLRFNMKPWQQKIVARIKDRADYRDILWVHEPVGNTGKTWLSKYLHYFYGAIMTGGKEADMKHAIKRWQQMTNHYPTTIIIDLARSAKLNEKGFSTIEQIKNGLFFDGKYFSGMCSTLIPPHIIVFANTTPNVEHMSIDRWSIQRINPDTYDFEDETYLFLKK